MNTFELTTRALEYCRESSTRRFDLSPQFLDSYNDAYRKICEEVLHPVAQEQIALTSDRRYGLEGLSRQVKQIVKISTDRDYSNSQAKTAEYPFCVETPGEIVVPNAEESAAMWIKYEYLPTPLVQASSTDDLTPGAFPSLLQDIYHLALAYFAAADYWGIRANGASQKFWIDKFYTSIDNLGPVADTQSVRLKNVYPRQPF